MGEARDYINKLIKERNLSEPVKKKKKKGLVTWAKEAVGGVIKRIKEKVTPTPSKPSITLPSGVKTPEQIREFRELMQLKKKRTTTITGVRG